MSSTRRTLTPARYVSIGASSIGGLALAALVAAFIPARRAASIEPAQALRTE